MARLGEQLVAARVLTAEQVEQALRAQVVWGGRFGTNLIELNCLDLDELSRALGTQHSLPAALARHFDKADLEIQQLLPRELAVKYSIVPLVRIGKGDKIAIATLDPLKAAARAQIAAGLEIEPSDLVVSVAAELRIRYHLERVYEIRRDSRFLRSRGKTPSVPFPALEINVEPDSAVDISIPINIDTDEEEISASVALPIAAIEDLTAQLDDAIETIEPTQPGPSGRERRTYVRTLADAEPDTKALGRIAIRRVAIATPGKGTPVDDAGEVSTFDAATRAIRHGPNRDRVAELVIDTLQRFATICEAAMLLVIRGEVAIGWKWFSRSGATAAPEIAVPMDQPGLVPSAVLRDKTTRCPAAELGPIDQRLLNALDDRDAELVVVPITIAGKVMCLIATAIKPDADVDSIETIAQAAAAAFARLIRSASR